MRITFALLLSLSASLACAEQYGAPITMKHPVSLEAAVKQLGDRAAADVLLESKVDKVCSARGCWIGLKSASGEIHVTFENEAFFVPLTLMGKTVLAQGRLTKVEMTLAETREYVKDSGGDPATVNKPGVRYELVASGLEVKT
jgi:hypothetical protein